MTEKLAENIRSFRKQRGYTQEQLAEAVHVTVGAVHKWETHRACPDLDMLMELADLFDVSVDILLGYQPKDNSLNATFERLYGYCRTMNPAALSEAGKALSRYPHSFRIIYACAEVYMLFGSADHSIEYLRLAADCFDRARLLLAQNDDPRINDTTICRSIAFVHVLMGEYSQAASILTANNAGGYFSGEIGFLLSAYTDKPGEAAPYLTDGLLQALNFTVYSCLGYVFLYRSRGDWQQMNELTAACAGLLEALSTGEGGGFMDKINAEILLLSAYARKNAGFSEKARETLSKAASLAERFDSDPDYSMRNMRFIDGNTKAIAGDPFGGSAAQGIDSILQLLDDNELAQWWKER